jgi:hypothetical protein
MGYEAICLNPFNYDTILLVAALAYGGATGSLGVQAPARGADLRPAPATQTASI